MANTETFPKTRHKMYTIVFNVYEEKYPLSEKSVGIIRYKIWGITNTYVVKPINGKTSYFAISNGNNTSSIDVG